MRQEETLLEYLSRARLFETTNHDEATEFVSEMWERHTSAVKAGSYRLLWNQVDLDRSSLSYVEHDSWGGLLAEGPLSDQFRIYFHLEGIVEHRINGHDYVSDAASAVVHVPGVEFSADVGPFSFLSASLDGDFVRGALAQRFHNLSPVENWVRTLPQSQGGEALRSTVAWLASEFDRPGSPLAREGKPRLHAERLLLGLFVECLAEIAPAEDDRVLPASEAQVRRAEEWIDAHLTEPIGVDEVAAAIGIGVRSLQLSFQRVRAYSPLQAILRRRLERAREILMQAPPGATVTSIIADLGIFELGRFSQRYRTRYGETPSQTLSRRSDPEEVV